MALSHWNEEKHVTLGQQAEQFQETPGSGFPGVAIERAVGFVGDSDVAIVVGDDSETDRLCEFAGKGIALEISRNQIELHFVLSVGMSTLQARR